MANVVEIVVEAKNKIGAGISAARAKLEKFGKSAKKIGQNIGGAFKLIGKGIAVIGGAAVAAAGAAVAAYTKQENAEKSLEAALSAQGDAVAALMPKYKDLASAIQDQTAIGDEATLAMIAQLRTLDVSNEKMEEAVKASIAFQQAGMGQEAAIKAAAAAVDGNFEALTRYVPKLRTAKNEQEKAAIVSDLVTRGYKQQEDQLKTTSGRWTELKGRMGDALEIVGKAIVDSSSLQGGLQKLSEKVKTVSASMQEWADSGGIDRMLTTVKVFGIEFLATLKRIKVSFQASFEFMVGQGESFFLTLRAGAINAATAFQTTFGNMKDNVGQLFEALWEKIKNPTSEFTPPDFKPLMEGFEAIESGAEGALDGYKEKMEQLGKITEDANAKIDAANADLEAKQNARRERQKAAEEAQSSALIESANEQADAVGGIESGYIELQDAIEKVSPKELADVEKMNLPTRSQIRRFISNVKMLDKELKGLGAGIDMSWLEDLKGFKLKSMTSGQIRSFIKNVKALETGLKGIQLPDLGGQLNLDTAKAKQITEMAKALSKVGKVSATFKFEDKVTKAIVETEKNTAATNKTINKLLVLK